VTQQLVAGHPGALDELLWSFAPEHGTRARGTLADLPATTAESTAASRALKKLGYRFVGPTTVYALMQSAGMVDDHLAGCWRSTSA
jgi:DNA-3-methyladenine glycosylase I